jgi:hypothetical protein
MSKIALCFLTYENLSQPKLWYHYIKKNNQKLNIYIHNKNEFIDNKYGLHRYCIHSSKKVATQYAHKSIVQATLALFKQAFLNKKNDYFILLSDKCIPLYNFDFIYDKIHNINSNIICEFENKDVDRYDNLTDKSFFSNQNFLKNSQWILLKRETVKFFIKKTFLHLYSDNFYAVDEHYFGNICNKYNIKFSNQPITYVNWCDKSDDPNDKDLPKTYSILNNNMVDEMKKSPCFFLRKISKKCVLPSYFANL